MTMKMAPGFFAKLKDAIRKVPQAIAKVANFVMDKVAPVAAPILKHAGPALNAVPGVGPVMAASAQAAGEGLEMINKHGKALRPLTDMLAAG
jgi:hypothetical protein